MEEEWEEEELVDFNPSQKSKRARGDHHQGLVMGEELMSVERIFEGQEVFNQIPEELISIGALHASLGSYVERVMHNLSRLQAH